MSSFPEIRQASDRDDMLRQCDEVHAAIAEMLRHTPDEFILAAADPEGWTLAKNVKHVIRTTRMVASWVGAPRWVIRLAGKAPRGALPIEEIRATNRPVHFDYGSYRATPNAAAAKTRDALIERLMDASEKFKLSVSKRSEEDLRELRGVFGKMSLSTFALFALKHATHHMGVVRTRLREAGVAV